MGNLKIIQLAFVCFACFFSSTLAEFELDDAATKLVRAQIEMEMKASLFYQTYSHYFESSSEALHGFAHFFSDQSLEEKKHADKLMTYLNKRNVQVGTLNRVKNVCSDLTEATLCKFITLPDQDKLEKTVKTALTAIKDALEFEKFVYNSLEQIVTGVSDAQLKHFIEHEYLDEQVESIKELLDYQTQLTNIGDDKVGLLLFDRWLMDRKST